MTCQKKRLRRHLLRTAGATPAVDLQPVAFHSEIMVRGPVLEDRVEVAPQQVLGAAAVRADQMMMMPPMLRSLR